MRPTIILPYRLLSVLNLLILHHGGALGAPEVVPVDLALLQRTVLREELLGGVSPTIA